MKYLTLFAFIFCISLTTSMATSDHEDYECGHRMIHAKLIHKAKALLGNEKWTRSIDFKKDKASEISKWKELFSFYRSEVEDLRGKHCDDTIEDNSREVILKALPSIRGCSQMGNFDRITDYHKMLYQLKRADNVEKFHAIYQDNSAFLKSYAIDCRAESCYKSVEKKHPTESKARDLAFQRCEAERDKDI